MPKVSERSDRLPSRSRLGHQNRKGAAPRDAKSLATRIHEALVPRILPDRPGRLQSYSGANMTNYREGGYVN
jgi:hypothetical protein